MIAKLQYFSVDSFIVSISYWIFSITRASPRTRVPIFLHHLPARKRAVRKLGSCLTLITIDEKFLRCRKAPAMCRAHVFD